MVTVLRVWCVGLTVRGRGCVYRVFDDEEEALLFAAEARHRPEYKVDMWEM